MACGLPNLRYLDKPLTGEDVEDVIACDLKFEEKALGDLREAIASIGHADYVQCRPTPMRLDPPGS